MVDGVILYTYHCVDGVVRTRCHRHIERTGAWRMVTRQPAIFHQKLVTNPLRCCRCHWEYLQARERQVEGDDEHEGKE